MKRKQTEKELQERSKRNQEIYRQIQQTMGAQGKTIGKNIKHARNALKLSQQDLADRLGISRDSLIEYEKSGDLKYPTRIFLAMCEILDCSPQHLMGIDNCYHRDIQAIQDVTGLSESAIEALKALNMKTQVTKEDDAGALWDSFHYHELIRFISYLITHIDEKLLIQSMINADEAKWAEHRLHQVELQKELEEKYFDTDKFKIITDDSRYDVKRDISYYRNSTTASEWQVSLWFSNILHDYLWTQSDEDAKQYKKLKDIEWLEREKRWEEEANKIFEEYDNEKRKQLDAQDLHI